MRRQARARPEDLTRSTRSCYLSLGPRKQKEERAGQPVGQKRRINWFQGKKNSFMAKGTIMHISEEETQQDDATVFLWYCDCVCVCV